MTRALLALGWALMLGTMGGLFFLTFVDDPSVLTDQRLLAARVEGVGPEAAIVTRREFCSARAVEATSFRIYRRYSDDGRSEESQETPPTLIHMEAGCQTRTRRINPPDHLAPGRWSVTTGLRICNAVQRCVTQWLLPVWFQVAGSPPAVVAVVAVDSP